MYYLINFKYYLKKALLNRAEYDKTIVAGGDRLQIKNLSIAQAQSYGTILSSLPECTFQVLRQDIDSTVAVKEYRSEETVILDYISGMSLLVIYESDIYDLYYLDRVFALRPGIRFSVVALDDFCQFNCYILSTNSLLVIAEHPAMQFHDIANGLKLDRLYTFFYQECARDFYFRGEQHEALELVYVDHGELHNLVGGTDILLKQQQLLLIDRNVWHMQYADLPVSFLTVSFRAAVDSPCSSLCGQVLALTARQITLLRRMLDEHSSTDFAYDCVESLLKLLLADLIRCEKKRSFQPAAQLPSTSHAEQRIADQLVQIISSKAGEKITLQQLADAAHISTTYLHRIFRTQLGMTPGNYLAKIRIEESKLLLRDGTLSMGEISLRMGFSSQQHFSRQFRTVAGMTPSEYVRTLR